MFAARLHAYYTAGGFLCQDNRAEIFDFSALYQVGLVFGRAEHQFPNHLLWGATLK